MSKTEELINFYNSTKENDYSTFLVLLLEGIRQGEIKTIKVEGQMYEVYADILETEE